MLAIMMCAASFVACGGNSNGDDTSVTTTTPAPTVTTPAPTDTTTEATEKTTTPEPTTEATAPEVTEPEVTVDVPEEGLIVYYNDFSYADNDNTEEVLKTLDWTKLTIEADGVYNESDCEFALVNGRLYYDNYDTNDEKAAIEAAGGTPRTAGKDCYYAINVLNDAYMRPVVTGKYTMQYDVEYIASTNIKRYAVVITECSADGQCYNSFHFRVGGYANQQAHFYGGWKTYSAYDPAIDLAPDSTKNDGTTGTPLVKKLLGQDYDSSVFAFLTIPVTIKLQWDPEMGHHVYMKTNTMTDFIKVSEPSVNADGPMYLGWDGWAVQFKVGAAIDGYLDNLIIWTGWGEQPTGTAVTYKPAA